jgi:tetratricopeptide (TPR) repeat protein
MADGTARPVIFISYCHLDEPKNPGPKDERWLTFVQSHLQPAVKHGIYDLWVDEDIPGGGAWRTEITKKLEECDVCVLLVSRHSLASDFIIDVEVETLRKRKEKGEAEIFPIVLTPCAVKTAPWIREINLRPPNGQPLSDFEDNERHKQMAAIAEEIAGIAEEIAKRKILPSKVFKIEVHSGAGLEINASMGGHDREGKQQIDISHLPETPYEYLVGRNDELKRLDDAWNDAKTNVVSLIAEGGAGKSALVNEWLKRLQTDNYRGAEVVLGWSFYSQGTKKRATAADEFLNWALDKFSIKLETTSAIAKGEAIAEAMMKYRVLLVLDGVEPLQHGLDTQLGQLKDQGLRALLRRLVATPPESRHSLIMLTSRLAVKDIARWRDSPAPIIDVNRLSDEAGAALLRDNGVWGTEKQLKAAADNFAGHPLALGLLASFLKETQKGDVRRRDHIRAYLADPASPLHDHARRVMESFEKEWLADQPVLLAIMQVVGLFDRPATRKSLFALRKGPAIKGLTEIIVGLDDKKWNRAVARLREAKLLSPNIVTLTDEIDAHPLVREWFGEHLRETNHDAWATAHGRLYEHLRNATTEGNASTLAELAPLYQAIGHGCRAGRHSEALADIYVSRICRETDFTHNRFYSINSLGAVNSDLAALSWFFEEPYYAPVPQLQRSDQAFVQGLAGTFLRLVGRLREALPAERASLESTVVAKDWENSAIGANNLSQAMVLLGDLSAALPVASRAIEYADQASVDKLLIDATANYGFCLFSLGRFGDAEAAFRRSEELQGQLDYTTPFLYTLRGQQYCELLLAKRLFRETYERAETMGNIAKQNNWIADVAYDSLIAFRAQMGCALQNLDALQSSDDAGFVKNADVRINKVIEDSYASGNLEFVARSILTRAAFRQALGDWAGAARDLEEVEEIAEPGPMRLFLCDMAIERARLMFAQIEAFAPLNGILEKDNSPKPTVPSSGQIAKLKTEAEKQLKVAADYIEKCGYHRRDEELAELQAVLRGEKKFADLPPRV